jgi:uncharacterized protein
MNLSNEFEVDLEPGAAWDLLTDVERIAPCMPGAELRDVDGDEYRGVVKVKVGPISAQYQGAARFVEKDGAARRAVLRAEGRETRGQGNASATITAVLEPAGNRTRVTITTDLHITGKVAQFGRGVLADVSNKLVGQFVKNLETTVSSSASAPGPAPAHSPDPATSSGPSGSAGSSAAGAGGIAAPPTQRPEQPMPAEPVDLLRVAGPPLVRRVVPALASALAVVAAVSVIRRRRRR